MKKQKYGMKEFSAAHGLMCAKRSCYGLYRGYRIHVKYAVMGNPACLITIVTDTKGRDKDIERYLEKNKRELKISQYGVVGIGLMVSPQVYRGVFRRVEEILDKIIAQLTKLGCPNAVFCPYCGTELTGNTVEMEESGIPFKAHESCYERAYDAMRRKEEAERAVPDKKAAGLGGALLGALAGAVTFILMYLWWNFAAVAAAISVFLGAWLYGKMGGKNTPFKVVSVAALSLIVMLAVFALCLFLQANANMEGFDGSVIQKIAYDLQNDGQYKVRVILNFVFIFVFDLIGTAYTLFSFLRARKSIASQMRKIG